MTRSTSSLAVLIFVLNMSMPIVDLWLSMPIGWPARTLDQSSLLDSKLLTKLVLPTPGKMIIESTAAAYHDSIAS